MSTHALPSGLSSPLASVSIQPAASSSSSSSPAPSPAAPAASSSSASAGFHGGGRHGHQEQAQTAKNKAYSRMIGSATAGLLELTLFHPVDTITKRLMSNKTRVTSLPALNAIIFKQHAAAGAGTKLLSLFPGLGYAAGYKVLQRTYKFGGQPYVMDTLNRNCGGWFLRTFGEKRGQTLMQATAGSLIGVGEVLLLPLDVLKIKAQTNPAAFGDHKGLGALRMLWSEGRSLYAGAGATALRNAPGSFALFGGAEVMYQYAFHVKDRKEATVAQHLSASVAGSIASITVSAPLDTIKTRIQNQNFGVRSSGRAVFADLMRVEGPTALFKGLTPKIANWLIAALTVGKQ